MKLRLYPDPVLKQKSQKIDHITQETLDIIEKMKDRLYTDGAGGYAAPQFGILQRLLVIDASFGTQEDKLLRMINPEITWFSEEKNVMQEGCMSIPWGRIQLERPAEVIFTYIDHHKEPQEKHATGYLARCIQHEMDHLNGILLFDHLSKTRAQFYIKKFKRRKAEGKSFDD